MRRWSDWLLLQTGNFQFIPQSSGVYQIRWAIGGKPQPISRANGVDESGLLYIGKAKFLQLKIASFWRYIMSEREKPEGTAGYAYAFYFYKWKFKPEQLEVRWMCISEGDINREQARLVFRYKSKYLDTPPLNISIERSC